MDVKAINPFCLLIITHTPTHPWPWLNRSQFKVVLLEAKTHLTYHAVNWERQGEEAGGKTVSFFRESLFVSKVVQDLWHWFPCLHVASFCSVHDFVSKLVNFLKVYKAPYHGLQDTLLCQQSGHIWYPYTIK